MVIVAAFHFAKPLPDTHFDESFIPKANSVRYVAVGNNSTVAGLFWIKALTNLGESYLTGTEFAYLGHIANLCTELDSLFYTPYYVVGGISAMDAPDTSDFAVFRRANRVFPEDWRIALYFALRLANGPYPDKKAAADVMRPYFDSPDTTIPSHIRTIYRTFELDTMQTEMAVSTILEDVLQPRYKAFRESFSNKMYRVLGYHDAKDSVVKRNALQSIKNIIEAVSDGKMHPRQAFVMLMNMKFVEPRRKEDDSAAVTDSSVVDSAKVADTLAVTDSSATPDSFAPSGNSI